MVYMVSMMYIESMMSVVSKTAHAIYLVHCMFLQKDALSLCRASEGILHVKI